MTAAVKDLVIEQGATFTLGFNWHQPDETDPTLPGPAYDLTGCTARMQIRRKQGEPALVTATSEAAVDAEAIAAGAGRIVLGGATGRIDITLTDEDTDLISAKTAVYDLEIEWPIQPGELRPRVDRLLQGSVTVDPNVTQVIPGDPPVT